VKSQPLTDAELERLSGTLGRFDNKHPMNLEHLDGFLAALICGPEIVRPGEYLPVICGNDMVLEDWRNELCPCGSGKKFKYCCGKVTLH
jgi:uncharacterized protein YecA (UPF0149 family)